MPRAHGGRSFHLEKLQTSNKVYQEISQRCKEDKYMTGYTDAKDDANPPKVSSYFSGKRPDMYTKV